MNQSLEMITPFISTKNNNPQVKKENNLVHINFCRAKFLFNLKELIFNSINMKPTLEPFLSFK
jgi:hypothetical protein